MPAMAKMDWAKIWNQEINLAIPRGRQEPNHLSHHYCLQGLIGRELESGVEPEIEPRHANVGCGHLNQHLSH